MRLVLLWSAVWDSAVNAAPYRKKSIFRSGLSSKYLCALEKFASFADFFFLSLKRGLGPETLTDPFSL